MPPPQSPRPPLARIPGIVPARQHLGQAEDASVMLLEVRAYSQGCLLDVLAVARGRGPEDAVDPLTVRAELPAEPYGVWTVDERTDTGPRVHRVAQWIWISPLPPIEGFVVVTDWPAYGIAGQRARMDGEAIRQAAWDSFPALHT